MAVVSYVVGASKTVPFCMWITSSQFVIIGICGTNSQISKCFAVHAIGERETETRQIGENPMCGCSWERKRLSNDFQQFWDAYPRKIAKGAARREFGKAIQLTDLQTMLTAIEAYKTHKPGHVDFCHPSTWLHQERWDDEWEPRVTPHRETTHEDYCVYLRSKGLHSIARVGPAHPAYGKPMVPVDWRPLKVVK